MEVTMSPIRSMQDLTRASTLALLSLALPALASSFQVLEPDPVPPGTYLEPAGVSRLGEAVVGSSTPETQLFPGNSQAFLWTKAGGAMGLGFLPGGLGSAAAGVSRLGDVVVGTSYASDGQGDLGTVGEAFQWTQAGGMIALGVLDPGDGGTSAAAAVSGDGTTVVGAGSIGSPNGAPNAFRWTAVTGITNLGTLGGTYSVAGGVSEDGSVVAGSSTTAASAFVPFRWTAGTGMSAVPVLPGDDTCYFATVSGDGKVVVGQSQDSAGTTPLHSFAWTKHGGVTDLGTLAAGENTAALAVSRDGAVIVGYSGTVAFRWTAKSGIQSVQALLEKDPKVAKQLAGWDLTAATAVAPGGRRIVGIGLDPDGNEQGWLAELPPEN
jgi:probable HAF family extracellular repeat protein